jgi:serine/threonine-protein kinase RsbW
MSASRGMPSVPAETTLQARLASSLDSYLDFMQLVLDRLKELGWTDTELFGVHMALEEGISNAIRHGNKLDSKKHVDIECRLAPERFWAQIRDEGPGFKPECVPDCCAPDRLEVPGGRGLTLIKAYMTKVEYNSTGNCLTLEKRRDAAE